MSGKIVPPPDALSRSTTVKDYQKVNKLDLINPCSVGHSRLITKNASSRIVASDLVSGVNSLRCEICGMESSSEGVMIEVDGAKLRVCERCRRFGAEVKKQAKKRVISPAKPVTNPPKIMQRPTRSKPIHPKPIRIAISEYDLVDNYPQQLRSARESLKLTQGEFAQKIGERLSIVQKLETGKIRPSDTLIEKIERVLRISLRAPVEEDATSHDYQKSKTELTIGDIAKPTFKKKDDEEQPQ
jgi:putative transcription factor